jgi:hypothetical protein
MKAERLRAMLMEVAKYEESKPLDTSMAWWVDNHGARAAGWLVFAHRDRLHRHGAVDFQIPRDAPLPAWMRIALEKLRQSPRWEVVPLVSRALDTRTWRVRWLQHGSFRRKVPDVLAG